ncbi:emp24/gp25L/p24 family/GOLD-domain-containing protein [Tricharina praecox]|uniref:emp24/gp25L/p24 family/GOLD-domain-containing protein n=1 Tax=Tricharina praecox TaxID=43433 RepID=UPI00221E62B4|nr:emp24/gp25L/p24 family/GOLD-domain-containing protein [Tricharina praecox]KAI5842250.1 emp24/gp25L/p24 family/GOLD-domain-containing protein [Tricharina praecox]
MWLSAVLLSYLTVASALKFDLPAQQKKHLKPRCIRNYVGKDTLVVVTATLSGTKGDGQTVNIYIKDTVGNEYGKAKDAVGETPLAFTSHAEAAFDVCFENTLSDGRKLGLARSIELDVDIGADARDWSAIQAAEKLKPVEVELRRIEAVTAEIVNQMDYLRRREQKLRDTNESTNERVKFFSLAVMATLVGLGGWQVVYLRAYFRSKHLI